MIKTLPIAGICLTLIFAAGCGEDTGIAPSADNERTLILEGEPVSILYSTDPDWLRENYSDTYSVAYNNVGWQRVPSTYELVWGPYWMMTAVATAPELVDGDDGIIKAISSGSFFDKLDFCGVKVGIWDDQNDLLKKLPSTCEKIISYSENGKLTYGVSTYIQKTPYKIGLSLSATAGKIDSATYWAE